MSNEVGCSKEQKINAEEGDPLISTGTSKKVDGIFSNRSEWIDKGENGLRIDIVDEDGIQIIEIEGDGQVYIYFSEISKLIKKLEKVMMFSRSV